MVIDESRVGARSSLVVDSCRELFIRVDRALQGDTILHELLLGKLVVHSLDLRFG